MRVAWALVAAAGCVAQGVPKDDCDAARRIFARCGVLLPLLQTSTCSGFTKSIARCVEQTHGDCDALAALTGELDTCASQLDDELPPVDDAPLPSPDARPDAGLDGAADIAGIAGIADAAGDGPSSADLGGGWAGYSFAESVDAGDQHQHQTPVLAPGTYELAITGTGNADLYVRVGAVPTTTLFDCAPRLSDSNESCTVALSTSARIYAVVRARSETSTYTLVGTQVP